MQKLEKIVVEILRDLINQATIRGEIENAENFRAILEKLLNKGEEK